MYLERAALDEHLKEYDNNLIAPTLQKKKENDFKIRSIWREYCKI